MKKQIDGIEILSYRQEINLVGKTSLGKSEGKGKTVNEIITERILKLIEKSDLLPWRMPWKKLKFDGLEVSGVNFKTKKPYTGANYFMTAMAIAFEGWESPFFLTFKQIEELVREVTKRGPRKSH